MTYYRSSRVPRTYQLGDFRAEVRLTGEDTDGACEVVEYAGVVDDVINTMHYHETAEEMVYVIEGRLHVTMSAKSFIAEQGSTMYFKRGAAHLLTSCDGEPVRFLVTHTPAIGVESLLRNVQQLLRREDVCPSELAMAGALHDYHALA